MTSSPSGSTRAENQQQRKQPTERLASQQETFLRDDGSRDVGAD
jgi:hypothetical protein